MTEDLLPSPTDDDLGRRLERLAAAGERTLHLPGPEAARRTAVKHGPRRRAALVVAAAAAAVAAVAAPAALSGLERGTRPEPGERPSPAPAIVGSFTLVSPKAPRAGSRMTLDGSGCASATVTLRLDGAAVTTFDNTGGAFYGSWVLPKATSDDWHTLVADCGDGTTLPPVRFSPLAGGGYSWGLDTAQARPGGSFTITGTGCGPTANILFSIAGIGGDEKRTVTDERGDFALTWTLPSDVRPGTYTLSAWCPATDQSFDDMSLTIRP